MKGVGPKVAPGRNFMAGHIHLIREEGGIARLVLAKPETRNALTGEMIRDMIGHLESLQWEPPEKLRFLALEAEGDFFCSGSDTGELRKAGELPGDDNIREAFLFARLFREFSALPFPSAAFVRGGALGAGAGLIASIDYVVAEENAVFGTPEPRVGLVPAVASLYLARKMGLAGLSTMTLRGGSMSAGEALRMGLVHRVSRIDRFREEALALERDLLSCGPESLRKIKLLILKMFPLPDNEIEEFAAMQNAEAPASREGREGMNSADQGRLPAWMPDNKTEEGEK